MRRATFIQPCSVKEKPDSLWQIADQHGVCLMQYGWHSSALSAHRALVRAALATTQETEE